MVSKLVQIRVGNLASLIVSAVGCLFLSGALQNSFIRCHSPPTALCIDNFAAGGAIDRPILRSHTVLYPPSPLSLKSWLLIQL